MSRPLLLIVCIAVLLHSVFNVVIPSAIVRTAAIILVDILAILAFFRMRVRSGAKAILSAVESEVDSRKPDTVPDTHESTALSAVELEAIKAERERFTKLHSYLVSLDAFLDDQLVENKNLQKTRDVLETLRSSLKSQSNFNENIQQNAKQVCGVADNLASTTEQGFTLSQNVQTNVVTLAESIASASKQTNMLLEESKKISDILTIMADIATMTKVLSINASIVAARAGTKGKEFDVVAKEVRKLSVGTENSLSDISTLITDIQNKVLGVSTMLEKVSSGILKEKDSMLSVAGTLQGVTLAVEIIRSITDVSGEKAVEGQQGLTYTLTLIDTALQGCTLLNNESKILGQKAEVSDLIKLR